MRTLTLISAATLSAACLFANGPAGGGPAPGPSGLLIADGGLGGVLEIVRHDVKVTINNGIAVTVVDQVFHNTEGRIVEALYTFPVPKNASVANFSMWINGKEMIGEVVEKERARKIYNSYKRVRRDPGLLEQVDYKTFEMRIFPIAADAEQRVRVESYQELDVDGNWCTYTYPLATTTRPGLDSRVRGRFSLTLEAKSGVPISTMHSPSHKDEFVVAEHGEGFREASLEATGADLKRDVVIAWQLERKTTGLDFLTSKRSGEEGFLQVTLTPGKELEEHNLGMDYVFVSDISGSMANDGKLVTSQRSVKAFIDALGERDRFELIAFNVAAETLFGGLKAVDQETLARAGRFLEDQRARGGTRLRPALRAAFKYRDDDRPLNIVVLSDGMTEQGEHRELLNLIRQRPAGVRMFCIGVGNDVHRPLLKQAARSTGGLAAFISRGDDFERQAKGFRRKLMRPAIADVKIEIDGVRTTGFEPQQMPNLYHGSPLRIYGRYRKGGRAKVKLTGTIQGAAFEKEFEVDLPDVDNDNPEIERMWAWHRVQRLMGAEREQGESGTRRAEIVQLCEEFSIPSQHASFLVLENDQEYKRWKIERRNASRLGRDRAAQARLRAELERLKEKAGGRIGPVTAPAGRPDAAAAESERNKQPTNRRSSQRPNRRSNRQAPAPRQTPSQTPPPRRDRGGDRNFGGGGGGGGAIDPISGALAFGCLLAAARRRRKDDDTEEDEAGAAEDADADQHPI